MLDGSTLLASLCEFPLDRRGIPLSGLFRFLLFVLSRDIFHRLVTKFFSWPPLLETPDIIGVPSSPLHCYKPGFAIFNFIGPFVLLDACVLFTVFATPSWPFMYLSPRFVLLAFPLTLDRCVGFTILFESVSWWRASFNDSACSSRWSFWFDRDIELQLSFPGVSNGVFSCGAHLLSSE